MKQLLIVSCLLGSAAFAAVDSRKIQFSHCGNPKPELTICIGSALNGHPWVSVKWPGNTQSAVYPATLTQNTISRTAVDDQYALYYVSVDSRGTYFENTLSLSVKGNYGSAIKGRLQLNGASYGSEDFALSDLPAKLSP